MNSTCHYYSRLTVNCNCSKTIDTRVDADALVNGILHEELNIDLNADEPLKDDSEPGKPLKPITSCHYFYLVRISRFSASVSQVIADLIAQVWRCTLLATGKRLFALARRRPMATHAITRASWSIAHRTGDNVNFSDCSVLSINHIRTTKASNLFE